MDTLSMVDNMSTLVARRTTTIVNEEFMAARTEPKVVGT
jgi:hypothetical protein